MCLAVAGRRVFLSPTIKRRNIFVSDRVGVLGRMGSGEDAQFVFAKYDYTAQGNQVNAHNFIPLKTFLKF